jgi:hypothetical protein
MDISHLLGLPDFQRNPNPIYEMNYYGAAQMVADTLGIALPSLSHLSWAHGWRVEPIIHADQLARNHFVGVRGQEGAQVIIRAEERQPFLVATRAHETLLRANGFPNTYAVGLPFTYVEKAPDVERRADSLLVMPSHVLIGMQQRANEIEYLEYIKSIAHQFSRVVFCVNLSCVVNGYWIDNLNRYGFDYVLGAGLMDLNALKRMRRIFDSFAYMTSNGIGSHFIYAALCGVKVSMAGPLDRMPEDLYAKEPEWQDPLRRERLLFSIAHHQHEVLNKRWPWLYVEPKQAGLHLEWARQESGYDTRVSFLSLARLFGWQVEQGQHRESFLQSVLRLDGDQSLDPFLQFVQQEHHSSEEMLAALTQLLARIRFRSAYILALLLHKRGVQHVSISFALVVGGELSAQTNEVRAGMAHVQSLFLALPVPQQQVFMKRIVIPIVRLLLERAGQQPDLALAHRTLALVKMLDPRVTALLASDPAQGILEQGHQLTRLWQENGGEST